MKTPFLVLLLLMVLDSSCQEQLSSEQLLQEVKERINDQDYPNIDGMIVQLGDDIIVEEYFNGFGRDSLHDTRSSFKSITSLLTGIAIDQGRLQLDDPLSDFFPELAGDEKGRITVRNLLEMKSGLNCEEFYGIGPDCESEMWETADWIGYCLQVDLKDEPDLNWAYNSIEPMLVGELVARSSGMTIMKFAEAHLFRPLGIERYEWTITPQGRGMTAGSFFMRPVDMLKIIRLVQQGGNWQGQQIVSRSWLEQSTDCQIAIDYSFARYSRMHNAQYESARYGFYWYREQLRYVDIDTEVLFASGNGGQYMMHLVDYDALIVFTGSNYGNWRNKLPFEIILKYLIPIVELENKD